MKLKSLKIKNFRTYSGEHTINFDDNFTAFIGKNDAGKSTIFDALDIFFGNIKPDLKDLSVDASERSMEFTCEFLDFPEEIEIDASAKTNLTDEYLVSTDNTLELKKVYECTEKTVPSKPDIYIVAMYPTATDMPILHSLNQSELKDLGESRGVEVSDKKINHLWRKALWTSYSDMVLAYSELKIDDFDTKAKKIYHRIEENLPLFFVFRSDRETTDSDAEAKDPMQIAVAEAQDTFQKEIDDIKNKIQDKVESVAEAALQKLHEMDPDLAKNLNPTLKSKPTWKFDYGIEDEKGIALNKRGSGTRRLVLLNFFRAQAEKNASQSEKGIIYAIEEPETSQHPDNQKLVIKTLSDLAQQSDRQVMITTHSPELLKEIRESHGVGIRYIQCGTSDEREIIDGLAALQLSSAALGVLAMQDFGGSEKIVLVEGKGDCLFLEHAASEMKKNGEITGDFEDKKITTLPVGGCSGVKVWIELCKHEAIGLPTYIFLDSDRERLEDPETANEKFIRELSRDDTVKDMFCTKKREIENYIKKDITGCEYVDFDDVKSIVSTQTNVNKKNLISEYWTQMRSEDIPAEIKRVVIAITD